MSEKIPENWKSIRLKQFAKARRGTTYIASELSEDNFSYPLYINMKSFKVGGGYNVNGDKFYTSPYAQTQLVKTDDLLIANTDVTASCDILGVPIYLSEKKFKKDVLFSHHVTALSLSEGIDKLFLFHLFCLGANRVRVKSYGRGTTVKMLDSKEFSSLLLIIPPFPEQKKIASILTSVDEVIENTQKQIDKLQDLKKATMNELLTKGIGHTEFKDSELGRIPKSWHVVPISDLALIDKESLSSSTSPDYQFFYIDITSVKTCLIKIPPTKIKYGDSPSRARRVVRKGDVLLSTVRPNLKAFAYVEDDCLDWVCSTGFSVLSPKDGNEGRFIFYSVLSEFVTKQIEALVVGSNYPAINSTDVKSLLVLRPSSLSEQKKIASILSSIDKNIEEKQLKLNKTQSLKKSLMQDLLTGKVRVKVD